MTSTSPEGNKVVGGVVSSVIAAALAIAALCGIWGLYWGDWERVLAGIFYSGITSSTSDLWLNEVLLFHIPPMIYLSNVFPSAPVYGIWHVLIMLTYLSVWIHLIRRMAGRLWPSIPAVRVLAVVLLSFGILGIAVISINISRDSILLAAGSLLLYIDYYLYEQRRPHVLLGLFVWGCMLRVSAAILVLILLSVVFWIVLRGIKRTWAILGFPWLAAILFLTLTQVNKHTSANTGLQIEQTYEYALMDRGMVYPMSDMKSHEDSLRYIALTTFFLINDSAQIKLDFVKRAINTKLYMRPTITADDVTHLRETLEPMLHDYRHIIIALYIGLLLLAVRSRWQTLWRLFILHLICWLAILCLGIKMTMTDHFLLPWLSAVCGASVWVISMDSQRPDTWRSLVWACAMVTLCFFVVTDLQRIAHDGEDANKTSLTNIRKLDALTRNKVAVIWDYSHSYFPSAVLSRYEPNVLKVSVYETVFFLQYYQCGQDMCMKKLGCSPLDWRAVYEGMHRRKDAVRVVCTDTLARFMTLYYRDLYHQDLPLVPDSPLLEMSPENFVYHIGKDSDGPDTR